MSEAVAPDGDRCRLEVAEHMHRLFLDRVADKPTIGVERDLASEVQRLLPGRDDHGRHALDAARHTFGKLLFDWHCCVPLGVVAGIVGPSGSAAGRRVGPSGLCLAAESQTGADPGLAGRPRRRYAPWLSATPSCILVLVTGGRDDLEFALALADIADDVALRYFTDEDLDVIRKVDGSPVTAADLEVESRLRAAVGDEFPSDGFLGEEVGGSGETSRRWIVDGIDGTRLFIDGKLTWGTLIALEGNGEVVVGVASSPALGRRWWASRGEGAFTSGADGHEPVALRVSATTDLDAAGGLILPGLDGCPSHHRAAAGRLVDAGLIVDRDWHYALRVAEGDVDLSAHFSGDPWDHAALVVIVEEAGGCFSDLLGGRRLDTRTALFTNGAIHHAALALITGGGETTDLRPR